MEDMELNELSLEEEFGESLNVDVAEKEVEIADDNLEGFASCFPDWTLTPAMIKSK